MKLLDKFKHFLTCRRKHVLILHQTSSNWKVYYCPRCKHLYEVGEFDCSGINFDYDSNKLAEELYLYSHIRMFLIEHSECTDINQGYLFEFAYIDK